MDNIEYIKLEITIPKVTYELIKDHMVDTYDLYLPIDEDIICKAVGNGTVISESEEV